MRNSTLCEHLLTSGDVDRGQLFQIIDLALGLKKADREGTLPKTLQNKIIASLFFEPSTRTRFSFEAAMYKLGGNVISLTDAMHSSQAKGESFYDMAQMLNAYADLVVFRHADENAIYEFVEGSTIPVLNAGNGAKNHPSQGLLDMVTLYELFGGFEKLKIGLFGDLKFGRAVYSLVKMLSPFNCEFVFISPENLQYQAELPKKTQVCTDLNSVISELDVLYVTRIQKERFPSQEEYENAKGSYTLNLEHLDKVRPRFKILHPLPRVDEIAKEVDNTPHAYYFQQAQNGLYTRMALLLLRLA